jgi:hypothetical protein
MFSSEDEIMMGVMLAATSSKSVMMLTPPVPAHYLSIEETRGGIGQYVEAA